MRKYWKFIRLPKASADDNDAIPRNRYIFVGAVFSLLSLSFIASTLSIVREFSGIGASTALIFAHSHLFLFFPTLGIAALFAFYFPAVVFTDIYWRGRTTYGRQRFAFGFVVWILMSLGLTYWFATGDLRAVWEISPSVLTSDKEQAARCSSDGAASTCRKASLLGSLESLRAAATNRSTIAEFARTCVPDRLVEDAEVSRAKRHCFAANDNFDDPDARLNAVDCCAAQRELRQHLRTVWEDPRNRSNAAKLDTVFFTLKVAFILVIILIGVLLMFWRHMLLEHYPRDLQAIDRCVMIGAVLMLFWPLMDYAYQQTTDVLFGREYRDFKVRMSLVLAPWGVFLLLYFSDPFGKGLENLARIVTLLGSLVALVRYQDIFEFSVRAFGIGAANSHFLIIAAAAVGMLGAVYWQPRPKQRRQYHSRIRRLGRSAKEAALTDRRLT